MYEQIKYTELRKLEEIAFIKQDHFPEKKKRERYKEEKKVLSEMKNIIAEMGNSLVTKLRKSPRK